MYHNFFIHLSVDGHLGCFYNIYNIAFTIVLAIVNSAAMNIAVHVSFSIIVYSGYMPSGEIAGWYGSFIPTF